MMNPMRVLAEVSGVVGFAVLVLFVFRGYLARFPSKWRCALLLALCLRLLIPFRVTLPDAPVRIPLPAGAGRTLLWQSRDVPQDRNTPGLSGITVSAEQPQTNLSETGELSSASVQNTSGAVSPPRVLTLESFLTGVWLIGTALILAARLASYAFFYRRTVRRSIPADSAVRTQALVLSRSLALKQVPPILVTDSVRAPAAAGLFRPVILLPPGQEDLACVLAHELSHVRRRDLWAKLLSTAALALHWWNPAVWLLCRQVNESMECACDERALALLGSSNRRCYSESILRTAAGSRETPALSTGFFGGLKVRLVNLFSAKRPNGAAVCALLMCVLLACGTLVSCTVSPTPPGEEEKPDALQQGAPLTTVPGSTELFDLMRAYRFDLVPLFDEGQAPDTAADYLNYVFFTYNDRPERMSGLWNGGATGFVSKEFLTYIAGAQFGADALYYGSLGKEWKYGEDGWTAMPMGGPEEPVCIPYRLSVEERDGHTVYTVQIHAGDNGYLPSEADFASARKACENSTDYPMKNYTVYSVSYYLNGDVPCFLSKRTGGDWSETELFDFARTYRFDLMPFGAAEESRTSCAGEYLDWFYAVCPDACEMRGGKPYYSYDTVSTLWEEYFTFPPLRQELGGNDRWTCDGSGYQRTDAAVTAPPLCRTLSTCSDTASDGTTYETLTMAFYLPSDGSEYDDTLASDFREALGSPDGTLPDGLTYRSTQVIRFTGGTSLRPHFMFHADATEAPVQTPAARYFDYFRANSWQVNPFPEFRDGVISDESLMAFSLQGCAQTQAVDWSAGIEKDTLDALALRYFGVTASSCETALSTVLPDGRVTSTGWSFDGVTRLVPVELKTDSDGTCAGTFDVYFLPEGLDTLALADAQLRSGRTDAWLSYRTGTAQLVFREEKDASAQGFYLRYEECAFFES